MPLPFCEVCKRTITQVKHLHRQNEKGVDAIWRCEQCNFLPVDPVVNKIIEALAPRPKTRKRRVQ
jgi:hypothetical protein